MIKTDEIALEDKDEYIEIKNHRKNQVKSKKHVQKEDSINNHAILLIMYKTIKRIFDIVAGLVGTILLIPITLMVIINRIIKKEHDGPIFYEQLRIGKNGRTFRMFKYRTMCINADEKLMSYLEKNEDALEEYKKYKKLKNDPRITKVGKFLRKTSLDEFPQFINVLLGNMSLVGPRPYLIREKRDMGNYYKKIILAKPGITGYWQVNGRSNRKFEERNYLDTYYIDHRGIILDLKIIIKTFEKIFRKEGAL